MKLKRETPAGAANGDFFNLAQAAVYLGLSEPTVRKQVKAGKIPCRKVGARYLFSRAALRRWADCEASAGSETTGATGSGGDA